MDELATGSLTITWSEFQSITQISPAQQTAGWPDLVAALLSFHTPERAEGESIDQVKSKVPLWSPVQYKKGATRGNKGVSSVSALVLDFDDGLAWEDMVDDWRESGYEFVIHTTIRHSADRPKWRAVFPLAYPVEPADWNRVWLKLAWHLVRGAAAMDNACKDVARIYYWPSYAPGGDHYSLHVQGNPLVPCAFDDPPKEITANRVPINEIALRDLSEGLKPGEHFERDGSFDDLLLSHGWKRSFQQIERQFYTRPGKDRGVSATVFMSEFGERFYCYSSSCSPIPAGQLLTKFRLFSLLNHSGDDHAAAKDLASKGFGTGPTSSCKELGKKGQRIVVDEDTAVRHKSGPNPSRLTGGMEFTTTANALRLLEKHGNNLRFCQSLKVWLIWNGRYWEADEEDGAKMRQLARDMAIEYGDAVLARAQESDPTKGLRWASASLQHKTVVATVKDCEWQEGTSVTAKQLDTHLDLLVVGNGTINLRSGVLSPSEREHLLTRGLDINFDPEALCPNWLKFLRHVFNFDEQLFRYVWTALGYSLTGRTREQKFFFLYGSGRNGKSTFMTTIMRILGPYAARTQAETLMLDKKGRRPGEASSDLATLRGKRFITSAEIPMNAALNEALIKGFTGSEIITCRPLYSGEIQYIPEGKVWMAGNYKPRIEGTDEGIWRRTQLIPFTVYIPDDKIDMHLEEKLIAESEGILAWMVEGARMWYEGGLPACDLIEQETRHYRSDEDPFSSFFETQISKSDSSKSNVRIREIFSLYQAWALEEGVERVMDIRQLSKALVNRGFVKKKSNGDSVFQGIVFRQNTAAVRSIEQNALDY